jgi:carbon-monoxide dehydrogenase medium subunit
LSLDQALEAFASGADARYLAGGQSLVPSLSLRLQAPDLLIDISRIDALKGVTVIDGRLKIGALTRHAELLNSPDVERFAPLLREAAAHIGHPAIRNKGTIGGSLAHADPAAELPAVMLALDAEIEVSGRAGVRRVAAASFFRGLYETALEPGELVTAVFVPPYGPQDRCAFDELARRRGDFAMVGVGVKAAFDRQSVRDARIAFLSVGPIPVRARRAEAVLAGRVLDGPTIAAAQAALSQDLDPAEDVEISAATRLQLARVLLGRVLARLGRPAGVGAEAAA